MDKQYQYRFFTQVNATEWRAPGDIFIWRRLNENAWSIHRANGALMDKRNFATAQAAIDAYWNLPDE